MSFDAQSFLDAAVSGTNDTKLIPVPQGEYQAFIDSVEPRPWQSKDGSQSGIALDVFWSIEDQDVKDYIGRDSVKVKQGIMLDLTPEGKLDMSKGKNIGLGRLREAVGKNDSSAFSFNMLPGLAAKVLVSHREYNGDIFAEIKGVAKM